MKSPCGPPPSPPAISENDTGNNQKKSRYGRPRKPDAERRTAANVNIGFNEQEWRTVSGKAAEAGVTPTEWARLAALGRNPPPRRVVPALNETAWRELSRLATAQTRVTWHFRPGGEDGLRELLLSLRGELHTVRMQLKGEGQ